MGSGLARVILYALDNDVQLLRDLILDTCLHCYAPRIALVLT